MIHLNTDGQNILITLEPHAPEYRTAFTALRSLLSPMELQRNTWSLSWVDFKLFKDKLIKLNLTDRRTNQEAMDFIQQLQLTEQKFLDIKKGSLNERVSVYLKDKLKTEPYDDQYSGIAFLASMRRSGLLDAMGMGKSLQALGTIKALGSRVKKTLIIAPLSVISGFEKQTCEHTDLKPIIVPRGTKESAKFLKENKEGDWDVLLIHPENLISRKKGQELGDNTKFLLRMSFDMIIIDEFHQYKNLDAKRSICIKELLNTIVDQKQQLARAILMTGTLISESPVNAYMALTILGFPNLPSLARFTSYFEVTKKLKIKRKIRGQMKVIEIDKVVGYKNLDVIKAMLEPYVLRRKKEDMKGFPEKIFTTREIILKGKQKTLYKELCNDVKTSLKEREDMEDFFSTNTKAIRLRQLLNHPSIIGEDCASAKYEEIDSILEEVLSDPIQKVIIWTNYRKGVDLIHDHWNEKYGVMKLYGGVDITKELEATFVNDNSIRIAAAIPQKAGTGVDFLARARTAIFIERNPSATLDSQTIDRIHRRVKTSGELSWLDKLKSQPATIIFLEVKNSLDELTRLSLESKLRMMNEATPDGIKTSQSKKNILKYLK